MSEPELKFPKRRKKHTYHYALERRKFIDCFGVDSYVTTSIREHLTDGVVTNIDSHIKLADCNRSIVLNFDAYNAKDLRNMRRKLKTLMDELELFARTLEESTFKLRTRGK